MSMVEFRNVSKSFGHVPVLKDIDLRIDAGEVVVVSRSGPPSPRSISCSPA
ncbi:glutamine ABC transporter ATP-binding protein [Burkholderia pseudomallei]|nr:glutamine ABC transporter ATP-binding protein [Burkholderia pseudomallei]